MKKLDVSQLFEVTMEVGMYDKEIEVARKAALGSIDALAQAIAHRLNVKAEPATFSDLGVLAGFYPRTTSVPCPAAIAVRDEEGEWESPHKGKTVVVVDDDITTLAMAKAVLSHAGCDVVTKVTAEDAWEYFQDPDSDPKVLIADIQLPGKDGHWLCQQVYNLYEGKKPRTGDQIGIAIATISGKIPYLVGSNKLEPVDGFIHLGKPVDWTILADFCGYFLADTEQEKAKLRAALEAQSENARYAAAPVALQPARKTAEGELD